MKTTLEAYFEWRQLMKQGAFEPALACAQAMAASAVPGDNAMLQAVEQCLRITGKAVNTVSRIKQGYDELAPGNSEAAEWWVERGASLMEAGALLEAAGSFERATSLDAQSVSAWCGLGAAKAELEDLYPLEEALQCFERALEVNPASEEAWYGKGLVLTQAGRSQEALQCYDHVIQELNGQHAGAWMGKGLEMATVTRLMTEPLAALHYGFSLSAGSREHTVCHGLHLLAIDQAQEAIECFEAALGLEPEAEDLWFYCGVARIRRTLYAGAIECFDYIITQNPNNAAAWYYKGDALKHMDKLDEMKACWDMAAGLGYRRAGN